MLVGGDYYSTSPINFVARLESTGSLDTGFAASSFNEGARFSCLWGQPDGKILVGGNFKDYGGMARTNVARLTATGTLDASFVPPTTTTPVYTEGVVMRRIQVQ